MSKILTICLLALSSSLTISAKRIDAQTSAQDLVWKAVYYAKANDKLKAQHLSYIEDLTRVETDYTTRGVDSQNSVKQVDGSKRDLAGLKLGMGDLLEILAVRHRFSYADPRQIVINGRDCFVLDFQPKSGLTDATNEDKFINRLRGSLIIDKNNYSLWRVTGYIKGDKFSFKATKFRVFWVTIELEEFTLEFNQINHMGIMVESEAKALARYNIALTGFRGEREYSYKFRSYTYR